MKIIKNATKIHVKEFAREEAARAWCTTKTQSKTMDLELAEAFADILMPYICKLGIYHNSKKKKGGIILFAK